MQAEFSNSSEWEAWQKLWPTNNRRGAKIIYDQAANVVRMLVRLDGTISEKAFPAEKSLSATPDEATKSARERFSHGVRRKNQFCPPTNSLKKRGLHGIISL